MQDGNPPTFVEADTPAFDAAVARAMARITVAAAPNFKPPQPTRKVWFATTEAWELLGFKSARALLEWRKRLGSNVIEGKHYRNTNGPNTLRPEYQWHVPRCQELRNTPSAQLEAN